MRFYFRGKMMWRSGVITWEDDDGKIHHGQKYVLRNSDDEDNPQFIAFHTWNSVLREKLNKSNGIFNVRLSFDVFEYGDTYHTDIKCIGVTLKRKRG